MDETIIENWNKKVKKSDLVYHLGDFAWKNVKYYRERLNRNGRIRRANLKKNPLPPEAFKVYDTKTRYHYIAMGWM